MINIYELKLLNIVINNIIYPKGFFSFGGSYNIDKN